MEGEKVNDLSFRQVAPVSIRTQNLRLEISQPPSALDKLRSSFKGSKPSIPEPKIIVDDVSASMPAGSLTAILGGSGSGKTSLLNLMSNRMSGSRLQKSGSTFFNGDTRLENIRSAYVMQQDILLPTLTVRETLQYSAELRLPPPVTAAERHAIVEEVLLELGLKECANTRIGNHEHRGCSGGEKRRTSLGVQLLANPSVLFLDEVTTGLDATSALQLITTLKQLVQKGRTIIVTLHQPRSEIWGLFDNIILLSGGSSLYSGPRDACLPYFTDLGYPLPPFVNPAEHIIDLAAIDRRTSTLEEKSLRLVGILKESWKRSTQNLLKIEPENTGSLTESSQDNGRASFGRQLRVQTLRTVKTTFRDPMGIAGSLTEAVFLAVITGWVFINLDGSLTGIRSRQGALYTAAAQQGFLILVFETYRLATDIRVFDREHAEGVVGVSSFLLSRRLARMFIEDVPVPLIFSVIFYFMAGFRHLPSQFFVFYAVVLLSQYLAVTLAMFCISLSRDLAGASLIANMVFTFQTLCSGFFVQSNQIPVYLRWIKYIAYVWYANGALNANEFIAHTSDPAGQFYDCPYPGGSENPDCKAYTGVFIMDALGFPTDGWVWRPCLVMTAFVILFYGSAAVAFKFKKVDIEISKARKSTGMETSQGDEVPATVSAGTDRAVRVTLHKCSLDVRLTRIRTKTTTKTILNPLSTTFEPGLLNVIMGPSGSGKTSLLNLMAGRLDNSIKTRYLLGGEMLYNGAVPSENTTRSITSYVCQDDDALLPTLTVRETLYFAAALRLPTWMSKEEKEKRADSVLLKLGLRDCADNLVGNELIKGISGGEKRRVSIAVQILTEPRILLLDEPTSGLDAFTAASILEFLKSLAAEGRTVILTIHQPGSNLFSSFGNILLLARGGFPVYAGRGTAMLSHFVALGYPCPETTNPSDFALDLISVNLQHSEKEALSREKVGFLVSDWSNNGETAQSALHVHAPAELGSLQREMTPFRISLPLLLKRSFINFRRDPTAVVARTSQALGYGVIVSLFFAPLKDDYESVQSRLGFIQEFVAIYFVGMLQNVAVYPSEKNVFYREWEERVYSVEAFFLQYTIMEVPFEIVTSLVFSVLADMAVGLPRTALMYFVVAFNAFAIVSCGESVGIMFNTLFDHSGFAINVTSAIISVAVLMAGVFSLTVPTFLQDFNHLSPVKWAVGNLAPYSMRGIVFTCQDYQRGSDGNCPIVGGEQALQIYNLDKDPRWNIMALGICVVAYRVAAYLLLKVMKTNWSRSKK